MEKVRRLHEGYLPKCREHCARMAGRKQELQELLGSEKPDFAAVERKLAEIGAIRAQCQTAMLRHFQEVGESMPPEQGRRYLAEMRRLTLGFHEQIERNMSTGSCPHDGHH